MSRFLRLAMGSKRKEPKEKMPEELEEGELMPQIPMARPKKVGRPGPSQIQEEKFERIRENVEMRHA